MCAIRKRGVTSAVICTETFQKLATTQARVFGVPDLQKIVIPHPLGGLAREGVMARAGVVVPKLLAYIDELTQAGAPAAPGRKEGA